MRTIHITRHLGKHFLAEDSVSHLGPPFSEMHVQ